MTWCSGKLGVIGKATNCIIDSSSSHSGRPPLLFQIHGFTFRIRAMLEEQDDTSLKTNVHGNMQRRPPTIEIAVHKVKGMIEKDSQNILPLKHYCQVHSGKTALFVAVISNMSPVRQQGSNDVFMAFKHSMHKWCETLTVLFVRVYLLFQENASDAIVAPSRCYMQWSDPARCINGQFGLSSRRVGMRARYDVCTWLGRTHVLRWSNRMEPW